MARILIIDDDDYARAALRRTLERAGYTVFEAADGREALRRYRIEPAEIVITDILMPELDGLETIMALREEFPAVKIIALTGGGETGRMDFLYVAKRLGAQHTFHKPVDALKLLTAVQDLSQN